MYYASFTIEYSNLNFYIRKNLFKKTTIRTVLRQICAIFVEVCGFAICESIIKNLPICDLRTGKVFGFAMDEWTIKFLRPWDLRADFKKKFVCLCLFCESFVNIYRLFCKFVRAKIENKFWRKNFLVPYWLLMGSWTSETTVSAEHVVSNYIIISQRSWLHI